MHDLPFSASRAPSAAQSNRTSGHWGHADARSPPMYDRTVTIPGPPPRSSTYPPGRSAPGGSQHPSLSQSTHLIPTPAQTMQSYHGYSAGTSPASAS